MERIKKEILSYYSEEVSFDKKKRTFHFNPIKLDSKTGSVVMEKINGYSKV